MQRADKIVIRKQALPLQIKLGNGTTVDDGFWSLTSKEASQINIITTDSEGYIKCEIITPNTSGTQSRSVFEVSGEDTLIGTESLKLNTFMQ